MAARDKQKQAEGDEPFRADATEPDEETEARIRELQEKLDRAARGESVSDEPPGRPGDGSPADRAIDAVGDHHALPGNEPADEEGDDEDVHAAGTLGASRYVMAGFFLTVIGAAYVLGRVLSTAWGRLAEALWFQRSLPALARVGEEERAELTMLIGAVVAIGLGVYTYRRPDVHDWTDEVASELAKVTWPDKNEVTNSTIIVIVTSAFATIYLALLDRFWGFVTNLVYGS